LLIFGDDYDVDVDGVFYIIHILNKVSNSDFMRKKIKTEILAQIFHEMVVYILRNFLFFFQLNNKNFEIFVL
jgi:hypothetical protein